MVILVLRTHYSIPIAFAFVGVPLANFFRWPLIELGSFGVKTLAYFSIPMHIRVIILFFIGTTFILISSMVFFRLWKQVN